MTLFKGTENITYATVKYGEALNCHHTVLVVNKNNFLPLRANDNSCCVEGGADAQDDQDLRCLPRNIFPA